MKNKETSWEKFIIYLGTIVYIFVIYVVSFPISVFLYKTIPYSFKSLLDSIAIGSDIPIVSVGILIFIVYFLISRQIIVSIVKYEAKKEKTVYSQSIFYKCLLTIERVLNFCIVVVMVYCFGLSNSRLAYYQIQFPNNSNMALQSFIVQEFFIYMFFCILIVLRFAINDALHRILKEKPDEVASKQQ